MRQVIILILIAISISLSAQQAILPAGLNMTGSAGSASVSVGQIHYLTLPQVQAGVQQWYSLLYLITTDATNGTVTGGGEYVANTSITLSATPSECYTFVRWSDGKTDNPRTITVTTDATYTAVFEKTKYNLEININDSEHASVSVLNL